MDTTKHTAGREREVVLHKAVCNAALFVAGAVPALHKETAGVAEDIRLDDEYSEQVRLEDVQVTYSSLFRSSSRYRP